MASAGYQAPKLRSILIGIILAVILLVFVCSLSQSVKFMGTAMLALPSSLGSIRTVQPAEVQELFLKNSPTLILVNTPGRYHIYTSDYDLLTMTMQLADSDSKPWLTMTNQATGEVLPLEFVHRGLRLYDTPLASGRPIFAFTIAVPGRYQIDHPARAASIFILPDYTTGREGTITAWIVAQIAGIAAVAAFFILRARSRRMAAIREIKNLGRRGREKDFWQTQTEKHQDRER